MAARILHFGTDDCKRLLVLNHFGYSVDVCPTLPEFRYAIRQRADADAVLVAAERSTERRQVVTLTRGNSQARLILFDSSYSGARKGEFDLVIPPQTRPEEWLRKIAGLIERSRDLNAMGTVVREQSTLLRKDSEIARLKSMLQREKSATVRAKAAKVIDFIRQQTDPSKE